MPGHVLVMLAVRAMALTTFIPSQMPGMVAASAAPAVPEAHATAFCIASASSLGAASTVTFRVVAASALAHCAALSTTFAIAAALAALFVSQAMGTGTGLLCVACLGMSPQAIALASAAALALSSVVMLVRISTKHVVSPFLIRAPN